MPLLAGASGGARSRLAERLRQMFVSGAAITLPLIVTLLVLVFAVNFVFQLISPIVTVIADTLQIGGDLGGAVMEGIAVLTLIATIFVVGFVAETRSGDGLEQAFDTAIARVPGIGSVYTSFSEMSKMLLSNDTQSFQEVKLVEFPIEGSYTVAFVTADSPAELTEATDHENMTTLFMPMAPNPVMGGFVIHVSEERVHDVDLTVEEGVRSIVTSGVATGESGMRDHDGELVGLGRLRQQARAGVSGLGTLSQRTAGDIRRVTAEDFAALKSQTREEFGVIWTSDDESEDDEPVHYMMSRTGDDSPRGTEGDDSPGSTDGDDTPESTEGDDSPGGTDGDDSPETEADESPSIGGDADVPVTQTDEADADGTAARTDVPDPSARDDGEGEES